MIICALALLGGPQLAEARPGDIDPSFSDDGFAGFQDENLRMDTKEMAIDSRGRIIVAASAWIGGDGSNDGVVLARARPNGASDRRFGRSGTAVVDLDATIHTVAVDHSDRIVVGGTSGGAGLVARFLSNGSVDRAFADEGVARIGDSGSRTQIRDLTLSPEGEVIAVGGSSPDDSAPRLVVAKLSSAGNPASEFADGGRYATRFEENVGALAESVTFASNGDLVVAGTSGRRLGAIRLTADGVPRSSFGLDGISVWGRGLLPGSSVEPHLGNSVQEAAIDSQDRLVVAGSVCSSGSRYSVCRALVSRLTSDGVLDESFATDGFWSDTPASPSGVELDRKDRIVLAAKGRVKGHPLEGANLTAFRLTPSGKRDRKFSADGKATVDARFTDDYSSAVAIDTRDRILVSGVRDRLVGAFHTDIVIARFKTSAGPANADGDGRLDPDDECDFNAASSASGCPRVDRAVAIGPGRRRRVRVDVKSRLDRCTDDAEVRLMRARRGADEEVARGRTDFYGTWETNAVRPQWRVYAAIAERRIPGELICDAIETKRVG